jgi:flagellar hook-associated protein 1
MGLDSALLIASSGLRHTSRQMAQASQNVANAGTAGYTRKVVEGEALAEGGVRSLAPRRNVDLALRAEARSATSEEAALALRSSVLTPLAQLQGDPESGSSIGGSVGALRNGFTALLSSPSESAAQAEVLRGAQDLAAQLNRMSGAVARARQGVQDGLHADVGTANALLQDLARLDARVRTDTASGGASADDLDRRDAAVAKLAELVELTPVPAEGGGITLILRGGTVLPLEPGKNPLSVAEASVSPESYYGTPAGTLPGIRLNGTDISASLKGGRLGEALRLRDETLPRQQAELDLVAATLARRLDGQGLRLFADVGGEAPPDPAGQGYTGAVVGFAGRIRVNADVAGEPRLLRDGTHAAGDFSPNPPGGPAGFTALLDRVVDRSFGGEAAPGMPHAAIPAGGLGPGGTLTSDFAPPRRIADYAAAVAASQAGEAGAASARAEEAGAARARFDSLLQGREGVDVDQEMASLVQLQNAYAANARVLAVVQDMWDSLLGMVR